MPWKAVNVLSIFNATRAEDMLSNHKFIENACKDSLESFSMFLTFNVLEENGYP